MKIRLFPTIKQYKLEYLRKDLFAGLIIAAMSIPISMGYAEVAGLPAVYGLYGSVLPILFFAMFSTSSQFIFGVDAAPAAIAGGLLASMGISYGSGEAITVIPELALLVGIWLLLFYVLKAGRFLSYISTPVMGGFISGIAVTIIMMQIPKLMGAAAGHGELFELLQIIWEAVRNINGLSLVLGLITLVIILLSRKFVPKFPMAIVVMLGGAFLEQKCHLSSYGVKLLAAVEPGIMPISVPVFLNGTDLTQILGTSFTIAVVIMAETLLAENNFASKNGYKLDDNQEILACAVGNLASAFSGSCPVNGSVSRTAMGEQFGGKTQVMSLTAGFLMVLLLLFGTGFIGFLPVPVLTAIVISALMSVVEVHLAKRLYKVNRQEFLIFMGAFLGVLVLGTLYGVMIGVVLSFANVVIGAAKPSRSFLGVLPGHEGFYDLQRNLYARQIKHTVIYKFNGSLFFANIKVFLEDLERAAAGNVEGVQGVEGVQDVRCVIVDASGINRIDITAADSIRAFDKSLREKKIKFYLTEHTAQMNDQLRKLGMGDLIEKGMVRRTITNALFEAGVKKPYPLAGDENGDENGNKNGSLFSLELANAEELDSLQEFVWAFGDESEKQMEKNVQRILKSVDAETIKKMTAENLGKLTHLWHKLSTFDEEELLERLELHLSEFAKRMDISEEEVLHYIEKRRNELKEMLSRENPEAYELFKEYETELGHKFKTEHPEEYEHMKEMKRREEGTEKTAVQKQQ